MAKNGRKIRYAVVGLGYISQVAVLPAFEHAQTNSTLTALVSSDPKKLKSLSRKYGVKHAYSYEQYADCLASGEVDAVYIALPNHMHRAYTEAAAQAGVHVLCEKPMALNEVDCEAMIAEAEKARIKLMIAYRLHFERGNLHAIQTVNSGKIGEPRIITSVFSQQVKAGNSRLKEGRGRRSSLRHGCLLHQCCALSVPRRARRSLRMELRMGWKPLPRGAWHHYRLA